jgi:hypothetical protein
MMERHLAETERRLHELECGQKSGVWLGDPNAASALSIENKQNTDALGQRVVQLEKVLTAIRSSLLAVDLQMDSQTATSPVPSDSATDRVTDH